MLKTLLHVGLAAAVLNWAHCFSPSGFAGLSHNFAAPIPAGDVPGLRTKPLSLQAQRSLRTTALNVVDAGQEESTSFWFAPTRVVESDGGQRARALEIWLDEEHGVDLSNVEIRQSPLEGLGLFAAKDLAPGEKLFDIPKSVCIYPDLCFEDRQLGKALKQIQEKAGAGAEVIALATFLTREKLKGSESQYRAFIEVLPWDSLHPLLWTDPEVDLLEGTYGFDEILDCREQVDLAADIFEPIINPKGWKQLFSSMDAMDITEEEFMFTMRGAFAAVLSRTFESDIGLATGASGEYEPRVVIPLLDIMNHGPFGASVKYNANNTRELGDKIACTVGAEGLKAGEEIMNFYGDKPNWNMLCTYGFVSPNPKSQETTLEFNLDPADKMFAEKKAVLEENDLDAEEQFFNVEATKDPSPMLMGYLRVAAMDSPEQLKDASKAMEGPISDDIEVKAKEILKKVVEQRRNFLVEARANAEEARERGQETLVRKEVVEIVLSLLASEVAAVDSFETRLAEL